MEGHLDLKELLIHPLKARTCLKSDIPPHTHPSGKKNVRLPHLSI